ncbi:ribonuclease HII [Candidatus Magnetomorum sp. HK-1]|nr:ribonuclease HII [Candidatus Magnetomorum sp. HK-1]
MWTFEQKAWQSGFKTVAGIDEAGRGPLAGPVVSASVILSHSFPIDGITDSKKLTAKKRDFLFDAIYEYAVDVGVGIVEREIIDKINILQASRLSMLHAFQQLKTIPDHLLIDGIFPIDASVSQETIKKGDQKSISIAAASIIAKVTRDRLMAEYAQIYPEYGFDQHKGYGTQKHRDAIKQFGICAIHRRTFKGVKEYITDA